MIEEKLGISRSTMSYWFKDQSFTPNKETLSRIKNGPLAAGKILHQKRLNEIKEQRVIGIREIGSLSKRDIWMLGLGIYIGEGAKATEGLRISNSDPSVIRMSMRWFRDICGMDKSNFAIRLHLYPDNNENECIAYWMKVTGLEAANFRPTSFDKRTNKNTPRKRLIYGTAHISVISNGDPKKGRRLYRKVDGWMTGALNQV